MFPAVPRHNINLTMREYFHIFASLFRKPSASKKVEAFERAFAEYIGAPHCIAFSSGSAGLYHGLAVSGLKQGDGIIVPAYEFTSVIETIRLLGLVPVFAEVDGRDGNVTVETVRNAYTDSVKAVLVAHIHGKPAQVDEIASWCREKGVLLIEDCAHSAGATIGERRIGTYGDFAIFSFGDGKAITTCTGGMVATSDERMAADLRKEARTLKTPPWNYELKRLSVALIKALLSTRWGFSLLLYPLGRLTAGIAGVNFIDRLFHRGAIRLSQVPDNYHYRTTDVSADLGLSQLRKLDDLNRKRSANARHLIARLEGVENLTVPEEAEHCTGVFLNFAVTLPDAENLRLHLLREGIDTRQDYLLRYGAQHPDGQIPENTIYLPNHPDVKEWEAERIGDCVKAYLSKQA